MHFNECFSLREMQNAARLREMQNAARLREMQNAECRMQNAGK